MASGVSGGDGAVAQGMAHVRVPFACFDLCVSVVCVCLCGCLLCLFVGMRVHVAIFQMIGAFVVCVRVFVSGGAFL